MVILGTIVGLLLLAAGGVGLILTWINYPVSSLDWIEGLITYGVFTLLGIAMIVMIVLTPREN